MILEARIKPMPLPSSVFMNRGEIYPVIVPDFFNPALFH
jgi:hypothetical protein